MVRVFIKFNISFLSLKFSFIVPWLSCRTLCHFLFSRVHQNQRTRCSLRSLAVFKQFERAKKPALKSLRQNFRNICVIEDFDLVTKQWLAIDAYTCFNHLKLWSRLASLSAGSSDEITKFKNVFWRIALRHRANTPLECFALIESTMTETFPY